MNFNTIPHIKKNFTTSLFIWMRQLRHIFVPFEIKSLHEMHSIICNCCWVVSNNWFQEHHEHPVIFELLLQIICILTITTTLYHILIWWLQTSSKIPNICTVIIYFLVGRNFWALMGIISFVSLSRHFYANRGVNWRTLNVGTNLILYTL